MNYLAHLLLADETPESRIGNLAPDFARPPELNQLPPEVQPGIQRHRKVDALTDAHPAFARSKQRLFPEHGRFSGILTDLVYDHVLSLQWERYSTQPREVFIAECYAQFASHEHYMPPSMVGPVQRMAAQDWLGDYIDLDGMGRILAMMSVRLTQRFNRVVDLMPALKTYEQHLPGLTEDFEALMPTLLDAVR